MSKQLKTQEFKHGISAPCFSDKHIVWTQNLKCLHTRARAKFIHKYVLNPYHVSGTVLDAEDATVNQQSRSLLSRCLHSREGR